MAFAWPDGKLAAVSLSFDDARPSQVDALCRYCTDPANGVWIDTVATVGRHVHDARAAN
jgi:hypothetical protein